MAKYHELTKTRDQLLNELEDLAQNGTSVGNPKANAIALIRAIRKFANIQTILSDQADIQTRRVIRLTYFLAALTVALLFISLAQLLVTFKQNASAQPQPIQAHQGQKTP